VRVVETSARPTGLGCEDRPARAREVLSQLDDQAAADFESHLAERAAREQATGHKLPRRKPVRGGKTGKDDKGKGIRGLGCHQERRYQP